MKQKRKLFFNYSIDCEPAGDEGIGGPKSWEESERSIRGFVEVMESCGMFRATTLMPTCQTANANRGVFLEMIKKGVEVESQFQVRKWRNYDPNRWLGEYSREEQLKILREAKDDYEQTLQKPCQGYRSCCTAQNDDTFPVLEELGFKWTSCSIPGRYFPKVPARCWHGAYPYSHHTNAKSRLRVGNMKLYEMPVTRSKETYALWEGYAPFDLRVEWPKKKIFGRLGKDFSEYDKIIQENIEEQLKCEQPLLAIIGVSHNTEDFGLKESVENKALIHICKAVKKISEENGLEFIPASFADIHREALQTEAF